MSIFQIHLCRGSLQHESAKAYPACIILLLSEAWSCREELSFLQAKCDFWARYCWTTASLPVPFKSGKWLSFISRPVSGCTLARVKHQLIVAHDCQAGSQRACKSLCAVPSDMKDQLSASIWLSLLIQYLDKKMLRLCYHIKTTVCWCNQRRAPEPQQWGYFTFKFTSLLYKGMGLI